MASFQFKRQTSTQGRANTQMGACKVLTHLNTLQQKTLQTNTSFWQMPSHLQDTFHCKEAIHSKCMYHAPGHLLPKVHLEQVSRFASAFSTSLSKRIRRGLAQALWLGMLDQPGANMKFFFPVTKHSAKGSMTRKLKFNGTVPAVL